jgi:D-arabinose 5-phosphate isomerase GutQ/beta-phosphoglucomutase-like phosphatase (HAD superfamily)
MNKILEYNVFIFDFDGTVMDTESYHCLAWSNALSEYKNQQIELTFVVYQENFHKLDKNHSKNFLKINYDIIDYDYIYKLKQEHYSILIKNNKLFFMNNFENFLNYLIENNKIIVVVTNTSIKSIETFKEKYPILCNINKFYTKELFINKKPNPECYIKVSNDYKNLKKIGFEDSLVGMNALYQVKDITPVLIYDINYYYSEFILKSYTNIIKLTDYNLNILNDELTKFIFEDNIIDSILNNNINELQKNHYNMKNAILHITTILSNRHDNCNIYLSGMGKSGYVCKKSASTWQSLSIKCSYIDLPNLPHGDFGIFRNGDILILISNSGNTDEIIYILNYIKNILNKKITTISIVANKNSIMEKLSDYTFILENIKEADIINMTPSTSSLLFMALLDGISINLQKNISKDEFKLYHPCGSLGKK